MSLELPHRDDLPCVKAKNPDDWHPVQRITREAARSLCRGCPVSAACLQYAIQHPEEAAWGVWGGTTAEERAAATSKARPGCGTTRGYTWHRKLGQEPCAPCAAARAAYQKEQARRRQEAAKAADVRRLQQQLKDELAVLAAINAESRTPRHRNDIPPCGTESGYHRHHYRGESCEECRAAHAAHERAKKARARLEKAS